MGPGPGHCHLAQGRLTGLGSLAALQVTVHSGSCIYNLLFWVTSTALPPLHSAARRGLSQRPGHPSCSGSVSPYPRTQQTQFLLSLTSFRSPFSGLRPSGGEMWWSSLSADVWGAGPVGCNLGCREGATEWGLGGSSGPLHSPHLTAYSFCSSCSRSSGQRNRCALLYG